MNNYKTTNLFQEGMHCGPYQIPQSNNLHVKLGIYDLLKKIVLLRDK